MSDDEDPEVIADMRLRASTERDTSRKGADYAWSKPGTVAEWRCRNPQCRVLVEVTQEAVEALASSNGILTARGEKPLDVHEVVMCDSCRVLFEDHARKRMTQIRECMREVIVQLKDGATSNIRVRRKDGMHAMSRDEALEQLDRWGHPDVKGFRQWLDDQGGKSKSRKAGRL